MLPPARDFCKPCFLGRLWYTKTIAIVLTEQFLRLFGPRVEYKLYIYIHRNSRIFVIGPKNKKMKMKKKTFFTQNNKKLCYIYPISTFI